VICALCHDAGHALVTSRVEGEGRYRVDRCALFVDAGYVLADGAMAVHGTRQRDSVSWDYAGLMKLLTRVSRDRTGLPVLRCYWYEAAAEGRRTAEHNALADLPGVKLRLGRVRPGRREGVEAEMHRDLTTLARNRAVSDAVIVSAEEDLTEVVAEVQDLGLRVVIVHVAAGGNWAASGPLRQECDDVVEISAAHLRPFVDLVAAAEPAEHDEQYRNGSYQRRSMANGHGGSLGAVTHQGLPAAALPPAPQIYTTPVVEDYQRSSALPAQPAAAAQEQAAAAAQPAAPAPAPPAAAGQAPAPAPPAAPADAQGAPGQAAHAAPAPGHAAPAPGHAAPAPGHAAPARGLSPAQHNLPAQPAAVSHALAAQAQDPPQGPPPAGQQAPAAPQPQHAADPQPQPPAHGQPVLQAPAAAQPHAPAQAPAHAEAQAPQQAQPQAPALSQFPAAPARPQALPPSPAAPPHAAALQPLERQAPAPSQPLAAPTPAAGYGPGPGASWPPQEAGLGRPGLPGPQPPQPVQGGTRFGPGPGDYRPPDQIGSAQGRLGELPSAQRYDGPAHDRFGEHPAQGRFADSPPPGRYAEAPGPARFAEGPPGRFSDNPGQAPYPPAQPGGYGSGQVPYPPQYPGPRPGQHGASGPEPRYGPPSHEQGPYSGPQPAARPPLPPPMAMSLSDAVQAAHAEGFGFGDAVARDAPALWLEAVLARKPRMPSDLEARLLQGSALPIDSLLHDEVRHSLRRGFWDALERSRR
jgi:uncharacterized LabA/DUF88 family protein